MSSTRALRAGLLALVLLLGAAVRSEAGGGASPAESGPAPSAGETVAEVRFSPAGLVGSGEAKQLLTFAVPGPRDEKKIEGTRQNLLATGRFRAVTADWSAETGRGVVTFALEPISFVRDIKVEGRRQVGSRELLGRLDLRKWDVVSDEALRKVPEQVAEAYERAGFPKPEVAAVADPPGPRGETVVRVRVGETALPKVPAFEKELDGLPFLSSLETRWKLFTFRWTTKRAGLNRKKLDDVTRSEQKRLREAGWKGAAFQVVEEPGGTVRVVLELGPREAVTGKEVPRSVMSDVAKTWKRRNVPLSDGVVNRMGRTAADGMKEKGWLEAEVKTRLETKDGKKTAVLEATPGTRSYVGSVVFEGAPPLPAKALRKAAQVSAPSLFGIVRTRPGPKAVAAGAEALTALLKKSGYPDARVTPRLEGGERKSVVFAIEAGRHRTIASVAFPGASTIEEAKLRKLAKIAPGAPWWPGAADAAAEAIRKAYGAKGNDAATVAVRAGAEDAEGRVPVAFEIVEGPVSRLERSIVKGNFKTRASRIVAIGEEKRGRPLDPAQLARHQTRLSALGVFDSVSVRPVATPGSEPGERTVLIDVKERPTGFYEWGIDLNTQRGLEVAGTIGERNLFGLAATGSVSALVGKERQNAVLSLSQPAFFGLRLYNGVKVSTTNDMTYEGFTLITVAGDLGFSWELTEKKRISLTYRLERQTPTDIQPDFDAALAPVPVRLGSITPSAYFDERDDPFIPRKGEFVLGQVKISRQFLGAQSEFNRWEFDLRAYKTVGDRITFAVAGRGGYANTYSGSELPVGERFYAGGANTHRAFREKELGPRGTDGSPLGGTTYAVANGELRFPLLGPLEGGVFLDVGNVWDGRIDVTDLRWGVGAGIRLGTPIGPLRFDAGRKLGAKEGESTWVGHIALGYPF